MTRGRSGTRKRYSSLRSRFYRCAALQALTMSDKTATFFTNNVNIRLFT
jgi:hypothetical protein